MTRPEMLAADMIRELTQRYATTEKRPRRVPVPTTARPIDRHGWTHDPTGLTELHVVQHQPLLDQLADASTGFSARSDDDAGKTTFTSKPAARLEALDLLARIDRQSTDLGDEHGIDQPDLVARLLALSGFIGHEPHRLVRSWWAAARLVTQWDAPAYRPAGTPCPACWDTNSLRVRVVDELATCTSCASVWDTTGDPGSGALSVLAEHVRWCTDHQVTKPRHWLVDEAGFPVECTECLEFRAAWAAWRVEQAGARERMGA